MDLNLDFFSGELMGEGLYPSSLGDEQLFGKLFPVDNLLQDDQVPSNALEELLGSNTIQDPLGASWMEEPSSLEQFFGLESPDALVQNEGPAPEPQPAPQEAEMGFPKNHILHSLLTEQLEKPVSKDEVSQNVSDSFDLEQFLGTVISVPELSQDNTSTSSDAQVLPEIMLDSSMASSSPEQSLLDTSEVMHSPLSLEDVESFLTGSEPSSPEQCSDPDYLPSDDDSYSPSSSKSKRSKAPKSRISKANRDVPYEIPTEGLSKKERKKLQNKNAAIRYRMKKRAEMAGVRTEEEILLAKNTELKEQVESISREIKYMKDLMTEVFKAKGLKITFKN